MLSVLMVVIGLTSAIYGVQSLGDAWYFAVLFYGGCALIGLSNGVARAGK